MITTLDDLLFAVQKPTFITNDDQLVDVLSFDVVVAPLSSFKGLIKRFTVENLSDLDDVVNWDYDAVEIVSVRVAGGYNKNEIYVHLDIVISG
jgi:hypothetical protein